MICPRLNLYTAMDSAYLYMPWYQQLGLALAGVLAIVAVVLALGVLVTATVEFVKPRRQMYMVLSSPHGSTKWEVAYRGMTKSRARSVLTKVRDAEKQLNGERPAHIYRIERQFFKSE